jgi:hypothetical protein
MIMNSLLIFQQVIEYLCHFRAGGGVRGCQQTFATVDYARAYQVGYGFLRVGRYAVAIREVGESFAGIALIVSVQYTALLKKELF